MIVSASCLTMPLRDTSCRPGSSVGVNKTPTCESIGSSRVRLSVGVYFASSPRCACRDGNDHGGVA